ncbi:MAG TPA: hypothetical protein VLA25_00115, partial [Methylotenera sp.]|nr:hypothetical protein [Methylotenera sp.]
MQAAPTHINHKLLFEEQLVENEKLRATVAILAHQLEQLTKLIFASKQERFVPVDDSKINPQLKLDLDAETIAACKLTDAVKIEYIRTKTEVTENKPKAHPGRMKLPENIRREVIVLQPDTDVSGLKKIGDDITEV